MIANDAFKYDHCAVFRRLEPLGEFRGGNQIAGQEEEIAASPAIVAAAAHRGQEGHFVPVRERPRTLTDLLVHGSKERLTNVGQTRKSSLVRAPEIAERLAVGNFDLLLFEACHIVRQAKEKHSDLHWCHLSIRPDKPDAFGLASAGEATTGRGLASCRKPSPCHTDSRP